MTDEEVIGLGSWAQIALTSHEFNTILNEFDKSTVQMMLATKPEDTKERERIFSVVHGMREFIAFMQNFVVEKDRLQNPTPLVVDPLDDPAVHDIYRT